MPRKDNFGPDAYATPRRRHFLGDDTLAALEPRRRSFFANGRPGRAIASATASAAIRSRVFAVHRP